MAVKRCLLFGGHTESLQYLKEKMKDEVDFLPADKCWSFFQIDTTIILVCVARHAQIT